jgi:hypothetical protein
MAWQIWLVVGEAVGQKPVVSVSADYCSSNQMDELVQNRTCFPKYSYSKLDVKFGSSEQGKIVSVYAGV